MAFELLREALSPNGNSEERSLREELTRQRWQGQMLSENLAKLELAMEDEGWRRFSMEMDREFTRPGLDDIVKLSRAMYLSNPLCNRAVNVTTFYTFGQGVTFNANEDQIQEEIVDLQTEDEGNRLEIYSQQASLLTDIDQMCDGNIFLALFTNDIGQVGIRSIPTEEIRDIHVSSDDRQQVMYYRRCWAQREFDPNTGRTDAETYEALYPDIRYQPDRKPATIGGIEVHWEAPVIHQRTGGLKQMRYGVPETYSALDWARAYKRFLEDWHSIVRSLAAFAWNMTTSSSKVKDAKKKLGSTITSENPLEQNRPPTTGSVWVATEGDKMEPIPKTGATVAADDAKPSRLMVASAMNLPDTILSGDPQQGNLATARTLDRPTELGMRQRQMMWADLHARIFRYTIDANIRRGNLPGRIVRTASGTEIDPKIDPTVTASFPPILEHDPVETVSALVSAATLDGKMEAGTMPKEELSRKLMEAVGIEDIDSAMENLDEQQQEQVVQAVEKLAEVLGRE